MSSRPSIRVRGARQHNLRGIDVDIPHGALTVISGPSGSGKSSLAFDTLYAEGQRRYVETFSPYTRQFLERMDKPRVERIDGIPPAIAIEQGNSIRSSRSTVGTLTEIADHLKLLWPRVARLHSPLSCREIRAWNAPSLAAELIAQYPDTTLLITFDVPFPADAAWESARDFLAAQGYRRILDDGAPVTAEDAAPRTPHPFLRVVQDRVTPRSTDRARLTEALESAFHLGRGHLLIHPVGADGRSAGPVPFTTRLIDPESGREFRAASPAMFSFNNPVGACPKCRGFGRTIDLDYDLVIPDHSRTLREGVVRAWQGGVYGESQKDLLRHCKKRGIPLDTPFRSLPEDARRWVLDGDGGYETPEQQWEAGAWYGVRGFFRWLESKVYKMHVRVFLSKYRAYRTCPACRGSRFQDDVLAWRLHADAFPGGLDLAAFNALPARDALALVRALPEPADEAARLPLAETARRLAYLVDIGLGYLSLDRQARTLSGGELQRVNLTSCLGTGLVHTLFVLDEPSIGLHPRDTDRLVDALHHLRDQGNTVVVVEHEERVIRAADHLVDLGPGRGRDGGLVTYAGPPHAPGDPGASLTRAYLAGALSIPAPERRRDLRHAACIRVVNARENNLRGLTLDIPLGGITCFSGVSGSGKSTLVHTVLHRNIARARGLPVDEPGACDSVTGHDLVRDVVLVDQSPLVRTPRSNPAVYAGLYDAVRELFASTDSARSLGLSASAFSFNTGTGRCERCGGMGWEKIEMQFLSDLFVRCPVCEGKRFQSHVLEAQYGGLDVHSLLELPVDAARAFFQERHDAAQTVRENQLTESILRGLALLAEVGLGYLALGQPLNQLSGGESQRIKLVGQLLGGTRRARGGAPAGNLLILDEPTTGLHFDDIRGLLSVLQRLADAGHSLWIIEHNVEVLRCADWIIDLGPEAGNGGGAVVCQGTPEEVAAHPSSHTGRFLREALEPRARRTEADVLRDAPAPVPPPRAIQIRGARHHNLKNLSVDLPLDSMCVVTGLSGSGKSTLAFDIVFAEGQRRYLDCLNVYARQFVEQFEKPDVDVVRGIPPTVAIEQQTTRGGGKSTVGTVTEIHHFLRLLFAKIGVQHDPDTGERAERQSAQSLQRALAKHTGRLALQVLAPLVKARKGFHTEIANWAQRKGYELLRVDGKWIEPAKFKALDRYREHTIEVRVGELSARQKPGERAAVIASALQIGRGTFVTLDGRERETVHSTNWHCPKSGRSFEPLDPRLFSYNSPHGWCPRCEGYGTVFEARLEAETAIEREVEMEMKRDAGEEGEAVTCPDCNGGRLGPVARAVRCLGLGIDEISALSIREAAKFFEKSRPVGRDAEIARDILPEIRQRLAFLEQVGLGYLQLARGVRTLSGGESQRIRLAAQLGSNLEGVLYVLDEPTIGLHPRDNHQLLDILDRLKQRGNSLLIVEHDEDTMRRADHIVDLGPGAGVHGGRIVAQGPWKHIAQDDASITGTLLGAPLPHPLRGSRRPVKRPRAGAAGEGWLTLSGCRANNLKDLDIAIPLQRLVALSGVSGSGKSTLLREVLRPAVQDVLDRARKGGRRGGGATTRPALHVVGAHTLTGIVEVDQSPIGKTPRSTPATYTGILDDIRALFAQLPDSRVRGYGPGRFSYNTAGGRCEACGGHGAVKVEMAFLPTLYIPCDSCGGKRYSPETLEVTFKGLSIGDVLALSVAEAVPVFEAHPRIHRVLSLLDETGLGYLTLGQRSPTLSGGEAQRLKLVTELASRTSGHILYLLEEPTIGLHLADVKRLLDVLHRLVDHGHSVIVIEHHLDVIAEADWVLDLGPEGGAAGGRLVASGTPEDIARSKASHTGRFLRPILA
jgi:excinuclease ABC subunit A